MNKWLCIFLVCVAFALGWLANGWRLGQDIEELKLAHAQEVIKAQKDAMRESVRRVDEAERIVHETRKEKDKALADARDADAVSKRLRNKINTLARSDCSASIERSTAADTARDMCPELFARLDDVSGELAQYADQSRIAGLACEKQYDSLRK